MTEKKAIKNGFQLDLFSTMLSRKNSYHLVIGKKRFVKVKKAKWNHAKPLQNGKGFAFQSYQAAFVW